MNGKIITVLTVVVLIFRLIASGALREFSGEDDAG